ncbi:MAG: AAA family ATPase [Vampirovibrionales bacterium]
MVRYVTQPTHSLVPKTSCALGRVRVENFLLFETQEVVLTPKPHVCAFLGDAGAGKSLLMRALEWCLGMEAQGKAPHAWVRPHQSYCNVELTFHLSSQHPVFEVLLSCEALTEEETPPPQTPEEEDEEEALSETLRTLVISRTLTKQGKRWVSQWRVQGVQVTVTLVDQMRMFLVLSLGQHAQVALLDPEIQLTWLDRLGGEALAQEKEGYEQACKVLYQLHKACKTLEAQRREAYREQPFWLQQLEEIQQASLQDTQEDSVLEQTLQGHQTTQEAQALLEELNQVMLGSAGLGASEGILSLMHTWVKHFERIAKTLKLSDEVRDTVLQRWDEAQEACNALTQWGETAQRHYHDGLSSHEEEAIRLRLSVLKSLKRKYGASLEEVSEYAETLLVKLSSLETLEKDLQHQKGCFAVQWQKVNAQETMLWQARQEASEQLTHFMQAHLPELALPYAQFDMVFERWTPDETLTLPLERLPEKLPRQKPHKVTMRFASGQGLPLQALQQGASGGELTRVVLLLLGSWTSRPLQATHALAPVLLLDEVDTGTSGESAAAIARYIARLGQWHQIWLVTHQLGVAAMAHEIYWVEKHHPEAQKRAGEAKPQTLYSTLRQETSLDAKLKALTEMVTLGGKPSDTEETYAQDLHQYVRALYQEYHPL